MGKKLRAGDVFLVPLTEASVGIGQVVEVFPHELYIVVFEGSWPADDPPDARVVADCTPLFASLSLDAKLWNGDWKEIGNVTANLDTICRPTFKVEMPGGLFVESIDGRQRREATPDEANALRFRKTVAPVRLEKALKASIGELDWHTAFDELRYDYARESSLVGI